MYSIVPASLPLLHERPDSEPEAVWHGEVVLVDDARVHARVRMGPLVRGEPRHDPDRDGHQNIGKQDVEPDLEGKGVHKGKELKCE
jgi:hypothetical protein